MLVDYSSSAVSIIPALIALVLAIATRRVLLSLGVGIIIGSLLLNSYSVLSALSYIVEKVFAIFFDNIPENIASESPTQILYRVLSGEIINAWNMSIVAFLLILGVMTALLTLSGGARAFADWAQQRIKDKKGSQLLAAFLGVFIFVDDYFNSLAVGSISKPVTDRFGVSRAKLAYILDSTAAPMCVIMPVSSWGAYIMTIVSGILVGHGITEYTPLGAYLLLIPMNFYAIFALIMVFVVAILGLDIGPMHRHETNVSDASEDENAKALQDDFDIQESDHGHLYDLVLPIIVLIIATVAAMIYTGDASRAAGAPFSLLSAFENTDVGKSLVIGGLFGVLSSLISVGRQKLNLATILHTIWIGAKSMLPAILILIFAWVIGSVIKDMNTGKYLASLVQDNIDIRWLPAILFMLSGIMAFSTGTSWGTFSIMLPIAGDIAGSTEPALLLPVLGAVLAGSVFGDHCSPISDTTILSSTGAGCKHIDHVSTQLPYAVIVAFISVIGYVVLGLTDSTLIALGVATVAFIIACRVMYQISRAKKEQILKNA